MTDTALGAALADAVAGTGIPGAVALVGDRDGIRAAACLGLADPATGRAMAPDTMFQLASMTKAVVSVAAMQLVEAGRLALDAPLASLLPQLGRAQVLDGFDATGSPVLRAPVRPVTLRHLLTHTAGFGYDFGNADMLRARGPAGPPPAGTLAWLDVPLLFDPGDRWEYGIATDFVGLAIEAASGERLDAYVARHVMEPLGMTDTVFDLDAGQAARLAALQSREADGAMVPFAISIGGGTGGEFISGGGGLHGTAGDYLRFLRMLLGSGSLDGVEVLRPGTVAEMVRNQVGGLRAGRMGTTMPVLSHAVDWFPDMTPGWGLGFLINPERGPDGRAAGSLAWAGIANTFYWIDPANGIAAVLLMQFLPFADPAALAVLSAFERAVYAGL